LTGDSDKVTDHMANERTYLAWVRTGIAVIALGFVVAKFQLLISELFPSAPPLADNRGYSGGDGRALTGIGSDQVQEEPGYDQSG
jgi:putative membrane protein